MQNIRFFLVGPAFLAHIELMVYSWTATLPHQSQVHLYPKLVWQKWRVNLQKAMEPLATYSELCGSSGRGIQTSLTCHCLILSEIPTPLQKDHYITSSDEK